MRYINPYDISDYFGKISLDNFKRFKKRVLNELDLEDNEIEIKNQKFSKDEIYTILDKIDENRELLKIYFKIYIKSDINDFLYGLKDNFSIIAKIQFLDEETKNFITPYLIDKLKIMYKNAFLNENINFLKTSLPVPQRYYEEIYESVYKILKNKENEIKNKKGNKVNFNEIKEIVGDVDLLNSLPDYFSKNRNDIALGVRDLAIDAYNEFNDIELSQKLLDFALSLEVNTKNKDMFLKDKNQLDTIKTEQKDKIVLDEVLNLLLSHGYLDKKLENILYILKHNYCSNKCLKTIFEGVKEYMMALSDKELLKKSVLRNVQELLEFIKNNTDDFYLKNLLDKELIDLKKAIETQRIIDKLNLQDKVSKNNYSYNLNYSNDTEPFICNKTLFIIMFMVIIPFMSFLIAGDTGWFFIVYFILIAVYNGLITNCKD